MFCKKCNKSLYYKGSSGLCRDCFNKTRDENIVNKWLLTKKVETQHKIPIAIKRYIINKQSNKCLICGIPPVWNDEPLTFILDHINGNHDDNSPENLRFICPNCDSQLDTYKKKNIKNKFLY